ncbi:MAG: hypothetical protein DMG30_09570 [Acidobacteria bacterium]|nr:MAG: hypothetical protein DMG30_09570 [Acidobacteriota bacterium]
MQSDPSRSRLVYSDDRKFIVSALREKGLSTCDILRRLLEGEYGIVHRKELLLEWADALGMEPTEILREAVRCGLLPNARMP